MAHGYLVTVEQDETGMYIASAPSLRGCHSQGKTLEEALANIQEAIEAWLEAEDISRRQEVQPGQLVFQVTPA